ncbi:MAG: hypothetical protein PHR77_01075 [Kiritimatiellae bacterium]|nr:hypothetical protein [Kiritimatiellia bacterium]MDD5522545.1 hypothetical protein [Kiritimatiellia bacterium]
MSEIKFRCPYCKQKLKIDEETLGQVIECPACKGSIKIPMPDGQARTCPECGASVDKYVTICGNCLYDLNAKRKITAKKYEAATRDAEIQNAVPLKAPKELRFTRSFKKK